MKMLFVCNDEFPHSGACANLLNKLFYSGGLAQDNDEIHILVPMYSVDVCREETVNGVVIHRYETASYYTKKEMRVLLKQNFFKGVALSSKKFYERKVFPFFHSDSYLKYFGVKDLYKALIDIKANKYDLIIAVSGAYEVAKGVLDYIRTKGGKFVFYQVDPCSTNTIYADKSKKSRDELERLIYMTADAVITTPLIYGELKAIGFGELLVNTHVMEFPGVDLNIYNDVVLSGNEIKCLFTGRIYKNVRNPYHAIKVIEKTMCKKIRFILVGVTEDELTDYLRDEAKLIKTKCEGIKDMEYVQQQLDDAHILVNIGNKMLNQVPSKLFEYISTGKPIVNFYVNENCKSLEYLKGYPIALNIKEDSLRVAEQSKILETFVLQNYQKKVPVSEILEQYRECTPEYCAKKMYEIFESVCDKGKS